MYICTYPVDTLPLNGVWHKRNIKDNSTMIESADACQRLLQTNVINGECARQCVVCIDVPMQLLLNGLRRWITRKKNAVFCLVSRINKIFEP